jgi:hypothetical protein
MSEIVPFFAVPFAFANNSDCAGLHADLRKFIESYTNRAEPAGGAADASRDLRVYESAPDFLSSPEPCVRTLRDYCFRELLMVVCTLNGYDERSARSLLIQQSSWFRVVRRGASLAPHNHPNASWSGIYCIDPGHHDSDKPGSGQLAFLGPASANNTFLDAANTQVVETFGSQPRLVNLTPGQLVMFPSWVLHYVTPYEGTGERITVSFNCAFTKPTEAIGTAARSMAR